MAMFLSLLACHRGFENAPGGDWIALDVLDSRSTACAASAEGDVRCWGSWTPGDPPSRPDALFGSELLSIGIRNCGLDGDGTLAPVESMERST
jgi:hypothetical protein